MRLGVLLVELNDSFIEGKRGMGTVLMFTGRSGVDQLEFRQQLLRVPEVSITLKMAQGILERNHQPDAKELMSLAQYETNQYLSAGLWRDFLAQLMQIGLYRRYEKLSARPQFMIGDAGECSASAVCLGQLSLEEFVALFVEQLAKRNLEEQSKEFLVGHRLESAKVYEWSGSEYVLKAEGKELWSLFDDLRKDHLIEQIVTLGVAPTSTWHIEQDLGLVASVVMDPLLSWMLPYLRPTQPAVVAFG
jgi:hypothetical protein